MQDIKNAESYLQVLNGKTATGVSLVVFKLSISSITGEWKNLHHDIGITPCSLCTCTDVCMCVCVCVCVCVSFITQLCSS